MKLNDELNKLSRGILDFFFPRRCPFCGAVAGKELLCNKCLRSLPFTGDHAVREGTFGRCAAPLFCDFPIDFFRFLHIMYSAKNRFRKNVLV